jgi:hypothetical protein
MHGEGGRSTKNRGAPPGINSIGSSPREAIAIVTRKAYYHPSASELEIKVRSDEGIER